MTVFNSPAHHSCPTVDVRDAGEPTSDLDRPPGARGLKSWLFAHRNDRWLLLWAISVLLAALLIRGVGMATPVLSSPQERFERFAAEVAKQLPVVLYGEDPFGMESPPYDIEQHVKRGERPDEPLTAELRFQETDLSSAGQAFLTRYRVDYVWTGDAWRCRNLNCEVERPPLTQLDRMDFSALLNHDAIAHAQKRVDAKRRAAEARLHPSQPLGRLLRSGEEY